MKEIHLYFLNKPILKENSLLSNFKKISNLKYEALFTSHYNTSPQKINVIFKEFKYDHNNPIYCNNLKTILEISIERAKELSKENFPILTEENKSDVFNLLIRTIDIFTNNEYEGNSEKNIFNLITEIFFNLAIANHLLPNGNKRLSMAIMINLLLSFGYFFIFSDDNWFYDENTRIETRRKEWESKIEDFFKLKNEQNKNDEYIKNEIYEWIKEKTYIKISFK